MDDSSIKPSIFVYSYVYIPLGINPSNTKYLEHLPLWGAGGYCRNEISTPAATAEPMTPEMFEAIQ